LFIDADSWVPLSNSDNMETINIAGKLMYPPSITVPSL
jgi:hypothetical protein